MKEEQNKGVMKRLAGVNRKHYLLLCIIALVAVMLVSVALAFRILQPPISNRLTSIVENQTSHLIKDPAIGSFLVARRNLPDPNFAETVILLTHYDNEQAMGLIINRSTRIPLSRLFEDLEQDQRRQDNVFIGGPVALGGALALLRSRIKREAVKVLEDVYLISSIELLDEEIAAGTDSRSLRLYIGYSGWSAGQLKREVELGMWYIFASDADTVFDPDPDSLWSRLISQTELRIVTAPPWLPFADLPRVERP